MLVRSATKVDAEAIAAAKQLKVMARAGVGLDNVDVKAATQAGVMVVNAPTSNIVSAAELAVALLLASARNLVPANAALRNGQWKRSKYTGVELADKTVGVVGLGRIGVLVAQRLSAFGVRLVAYDPYVQPARAAQLGVRLVSLDELLRRDRLHHRAPAQDPRDRRADRGRAAGHGQADRAHRQRRTGWDRRRGTRWCEALREGRVAGAGVDVYSREPCTDSPAVRAGAGRGDPAPGRVHGRGAGEGRASRWPGPCGWPWPASWSPTRSTSGAGCWPRRSGRCCRWRSASGAVACTLATAPIERIDVEVRGEVAELDVRVLELSALKGVFPVLVEDPVSYVNAPVLAKDRGVEVCLSTDSVSPDHRTLLRVRLTQTDGKTLVVAGTVTGPRDVEKLVEVDGFDVDVPVSEHMAFLRYHDKPGVVGVVGRILGDAGINIGGMQVSREVSGGHALIALTVDSVIPVATLDAIVTEIGAHSGRSVDLDL